MRYGFERPKEELVIKDLPGKLYLGLEAAIEWARGLGLVKSKLSAYQIVKKFAFWVEGEGETDLSVRHRSSKKNSLSGNNHLILELAGRQDGGIFYSVIDIVQMETRYNGELNEKMELRLELSEDGPSSAWLALYQGRGVILRMGVDRQGRPFVTEVKGEEGIPKVLLLEGKWLNGAKGRLTDSGWSLNLIEATDFDFYQTVAGVFVRDLLGHNKGYNEIVAWFRQLLGENAKAED